LLGAATEITKLIQLAKVREYAKRSDNQSAFVVSEAKALGTVCLFCDSLRIIAFAWQMPESWTRVISIIQDKDAWRP